MIEKKLAPHLMRGVQRFSEKIMRKLKNWESGRRDSRSPCPHAARAAFFSASIFLANSQRK
jgi:hypothetical protein